MLSWFSNWWRRRRDLRRRAIFRYWDGRAFRAADPLAVYRKLATHSRFDWERHPKEIDAGDAEATETTLAAVREVFRVTPFDTLKRTGLTEAETLTLLIDFVGYLGLLKKSIRLPPISRRPTVPASSPTTNEPTTSATSDSGSTSPELKADTVAESVSAS